LHGLRSGFWSDDSPLPSERQMTADLGVSRATVRQAIQELESEGWLLRKQGKGTFSNTAKVEQRLELLAGFSENMRAQGYEPSSKLLEIGLQSATDAVAYALKLLPGAPVVVARRIRLIDGEPLLYEICHLNESLAPGLATRDLTGSLYEILRTTYRLVLAGGEETIEAVAATPELAELLRVKPNVPLVYTERTVLTDKGQPVEFTQRWGRGDKSSFRVKLAAGNTMITMKEDAAND
jgi:GntR family transcriptional regulator